MLPIASTRTVKPSGLALGAEPVAAALVHLGQGQPPHAALRRGADLGHAHQAVPQPLAVDALVGLSGHAGRPRVEGRILPAGRLAARQRAGQCMRRVESIWRRSAAAGRLQADRPDDVRALAGGDRGQGRRRRRRSADAAAHHRLRHAEPELPGRAALRACEQRRHARPACSTM